MTRARGGKKFSKLDVKRVYFGNWLRDYSQAVDVCFCDKIDRTGHHADLNSGRNRQNGQRRGHPATALDSRFPQLWLWYQGVRSHHRETRLLSV